MQEFVGYQMWNEIDLFFSLFIVSKGAKKWKQIGQDFNLL
jgi:hypothetical protein